jgi:hypothetical protein
MTMYIVCITTNPRGISVKTSGYTQSKAACVGVDSISSRFTVLNTPISTTAPIDAKTHV